MNITRITTDRMGSATKRRSTLLAAAVLATGILLGAATPAAAAPATLDRRTGAVQPAAVVTYTIEVKTGNVTGAGTDADVYIRLLGTLDTTNYMELDNPGDDRERGDLDVYKPFYLSDLGRLWQVRVSFYPAGDSSDWYLDYVIVRSSKGETFTFPCYCWFIYTANERLPAA